MADAALGAIWVFFTQSPSLLVCDELGLIGKGMFAIDGCKIPSNASKEWSGTRADFQKKVTKLDGVIAHMLATHKDLDAQGSEEVWVQ